MPVSEAQKPRNKHRRLKYQASLPKAPRSRRSLTRRLLRQGTDTLAQFQISVEKAARAEGFNWKHVQKLVERKANGNWITLARMVKDGELTLDTSDFALGVL